MKMFYLVKFSSFSNKNVENSFFYARGFHMIVIKLICNEKGYLVDSTCFVCMFAVIYYAVVFQHIFSGLPRILS